MTMFQEAIDFLMENKLWLLKDKTTIKISDMSDLHIAKCISLMEENKIHRDRAKFLPLFKEEQGKRILKRKMDDL